MKHNLTTATTFEVQRKSVEEIVEKSHSIYNTDDYQLKSMISPIIGNAEFHRVNKELENERFKTLIQLARVLDDESMTKAINGLNYTLQIEK